MIAAGILDPAKVTRTALQNAASIAALMLTTEALIAEIPEEEKAPAGGPPVAAARRCTRELESDQIGLVRVSTPNYPDSFPVLLYRPCGRFSDGSALPPPLYS